MPWKDKNKRNEYYRLRKRQERDLNREACNQKAREYQRKWRELNPEKIKDYSKNKVAKGILKRSLTKSRVHLSDSYIRGLISQSIAKISIDEKRAKVLTFRIKKILCKTR